MCRLLGWATREPATLLEVIGKAALSRFTALACLHSDGWGIAWRQPGRGVCHLKETRAADRSPAFLEIATTLRATAAIVHLRLASSGFAISPANTHPFVADGTAFAHNGYIPHPASLLRLLPDNETARLKGETDSERYFAVIRQHRASAPDLPEAVRRAVSQLRELYPEASLNALILSEDQLIAVHAHARSRLPDEDIAEITAADLPSDHLEDYFGMRWARPDNGRLVIASTGFGDLDWHPLPSESVTAISMYDLSMASLPLMTPSTP